MRPDESKKAVRSVSVQKSTSFSEHGMRLTAEARGWSRDPTVKDVSVQK